MLKVDNLRKSYGEELLFEGVSFTVAPGERVGLVGRNGHGKTTLLRIILGEEYPDEGTVSIPRNYRVVALSQHIRFSMDTVLGEACSSLPPSEDGVDLSYRAEKVLHGLGIGSELFGLDPMDLSGGYQVRLNLAKALVSEPDLLLLDEPTNYLDIVSLRWLRRFLTSWRGSLIIITHDREFMDSVTTHTMAIHRKRVRKAEGPAGKLYSRIALEEEVYEKTRLNEEKKREEVVRFIDRFRAKATKARAVQSRVKMLDKRGRMDALEEIKTLSFNFGYSDHNAKTLLSAKGVSFSYPGGPELINDLTFTVGRKDRIAVVGRNGKGKSTLLGLLAGELTPTAGSIDRNESTRTGYFGQTNIERLAGGNTVEDELIKSHPDLSRAAARKAAGLMMFEGDKALKRIEVLSGGEKSRVLLGKLLLSPVNLLLLDEPTNHLDMDSVESLLDA